MITYLVPLVQLDCGEGGTQQRNNTGVCAGSAHSVWTTLGLPQFTVVCVFWVYISQAPGCPGGVVSQAGPAFHVLPRCKMLRFRLSVLLKGTDLIGHAFCALPMSEPLRRPGAW